MAPLNVSEYRKFFPVTKNLIYLNHASVAPLCLPAAVAMQGLAQDALDFGSMHYPQWLETYSGVRKGAARLVNCEPEEIAVVKNTSEGIATIAMGFDWRAGDTVIAFEEEFPANQYPWQRLASRGVRITWLKVTDPLEKIEAAVHGTRLLAISFVQFLSGFRADLVQLGQICRRHGVIFFVDAIQGLGAFPLDVKAANIDALAADGHKWLLGPEGCGILYISRALQERVAPVEFGWTNVASSNDYGSRDMTLRTDAGRYECGTLNTIGCYGLRAAIDFLLDISVEQIRPLVQARADQLAQGAQDKGYEILGTRSAATGAGIVSIKKSGVDTSAAVVNLRKNGIIVASRAGWIRSSPHFYITSDEIQKMIELLP